MIEYEHISEIVGKKNLWFTNIGEKDKQKLEDYGKVFSKSVKEMNLKNICVLDPIASETLSSEEAKSFDYFVFGGILGDNPPKQRTYPELTHSLQGAIVRNIGKEQMSTDNAVFVVNEIVKGRNLRDIKFQDNIEIRINDFESVDLPFRYAIVNGRPFMSKKIITYLKSKKDF